ncbi:unnamed protein product [Polarella glacialis]|uniref:Uncharacterized protein n=1 Tax=Polarella glacialis TaxID=89957 RepID=A0A813M1F2_POLGL|nr:unnamed protein product [Polarella glacialis]CAE8738179.1 unnamed protein product [Polarella glacialis]
MTDPSTPNTTEGPTKDGREQQQQHEGVAAAEKELADLRFLSKSIGAYALFNAVLGTSLVVVKLILEFVPFKACESYLWLVAVLILGTQLSNGLVGARQVFCLSGEPCRRQMAASLKLILSGVLLFGALAVIELALGINHLLNDGSDCFGLGILAISSAAVDLGSCAKSTLVWSVLLRSVRNGVSPAEKV